MGGKVKTVDDLYFNKDHQMVRQAVRDRVTGETAARLRMLC